MTTPTNPLRKEAESLNIMNFKLVSGEEIIALINRNKHDEAIIIVEEPLMMSTVMTTNNSYSINFQEWNPISANRLTAILRSNVVAYSKSSLDAKTQYLNTIIAISLKDLPEVEDHDHKEDTHISTSTVLH